MATLFRLSGRQLLNQIIKHEKIGMLALVRPVTLKAQPAPPQKLMGHDERNMKLGRPQSPHLTIYAAQMTSMLSISHRATGMVLAGYTILWGAGAIILPDTIPNYLESLECAEVGSGLLAAGKFMLAFPFCYHFWNGIRHLTWDMGQFLSLKEVYATGYVMLILAIGSAVALTAM
ncbi:succinate dehydrogenase cytochrome b560 subunit, mitochondrial-like isoform X1 [Tenebrio molitor]|jgi:succinate dehydrogenase (ubiquinone) cytochrome b560 subunit|uniref:succinate dehydrogenase cytochrome b560 subunit, mitochondrial-like isoform X1 n=1 Tax=Tenebrio molitor TaxID=7067 RepID=UPI00362486BC